MIDAPNTMKEAIRELECFNQKPGVVSCSLGVGFQWIDSPAVGASTIVVTNDDHESANNYVDQLSEWVWEKRHDWISQPL